LTDAGRAAKAGGAPLQAIWEWKLGSPSKHWPEHLRMAGTVFLSESDLIVKGSRDPNEWPHTGTTHIGDHAGCQCYRQPVLRIDQAERQRRIDRQQA
jgi:hypothetical protein